MEEINQKIITDNQTHLVVLTKDRNPNFGDREPNLVGHLVNGDWSPYKIDPYRKIGELDLDSFASIKILTTIDEVIKNLAEGKELPFVLANGYFPRGCGPAPFAPVLMIGGENDSFDGIVSETISYVGNVERRATGRMNLENQLRVNNFSSNYSKNLKDYVDSIAAISDSHLAPEGTAILFKANL